MLPWSFVFDQALYELSRFSQHLRADDRAVFDDLITQCKLYAPVGEVLPSPERKMSLLFWIIFAQHKKLMELQKQVDEPGGGARLTGRIGDSCGGIWQVLNPQVTPSLTEHL